MVRINKLLFFVLLFMTNTAFAGFYPIKTNNLWGYINNEGKIIIKPQFEWADKFSEGMAVVKLKGKYGYIDTLGNIKIECKFYYAQKFSYSKALVHFDSTQVNYIDTLGRILSPINFERGNHFEKDRDFEYANVKYKSKEELIDHKMQFLPFPTCAHYLNFSEGRAKCIDMEKKKYGYVDYTGNFVIEAKYDYAGEFIDGLAVVKQGNYYGFIDSLGKYKIEPTYHYASPFFNDLAIVENLESNKWKSQWFLINRNNEIIKEIFLNKKQNIVMLMGISKDYYIFSVLLEDEKQIVIDSLGNEIILEGLKRPIMFFDFEDNLKMFLVDEKWGVFDSNMKALITPKYDVIMYYNDVFACYKEGNEFSFSKPNSKTQLYYVKKDGKVIWQSIE